MMAAVQLKQFKWMNQWKAVDGLGDEPVEVSGKQWMNRWKAMDIPLVEANNDIYKSVGYKSVHMASITEPLNYPVLYQRVCNRIRTQDGITVIAFVRRQRCNLQALVL